MDDKQFKESILKFQEFVVTEFKSIHSRFDWLEWKVNWLEKKFDWLEWKVDKLDSTVNSLKDEFRELTGTQELEHQATRKLINQAFTSINENILYQEKVDRIERLLKAKPRNIV